MKSPLDNKKVRITVEYEFTTADEDLDEELIYSLLDNEPVDHVLSLIGSGTGLEWREYRKNSIVDIEDLD
jgi:hypothetical protein